LECTKDDVHATLGLPIGPKKVVGRKSYDCEKYNALLDSCNRRWDKSSGALKIGKMRERILIGVIMMMNSIWILISTCIKGNYIGHFFFKDLEVFVLKIWKALGNVANISTTIGLNM